MRSLVLLKIYHLQISLPVRPDVAQYERHAVAGRIRCREVGQHRVHVESGIKREDVRVEPARPIFEPAIAIGVQPEPLEEQSMLKGQRAEELIPEISRLL